MTAPITWTPSAREALQRLDGKLFASTTETAVVLDCDARTVRKAMDAGEIPSVQVGSTRRVPVSWIRNRAGLDPDGGSTVVGSAS
jgi:excisionase family DNA binding protein